MGNGNERGRGGQESLGSPTYCFGAAAPPGRGAAGAAGRGAAGAPCLPAGAGAAAGAAGLGAGAAGAAAVAGAGFAVSNLRITSVVRSSPASAQTIPASRALNRMSSFFS